MKVNTMLKVWPCTEVCSGFTGISCIHEKKVLCYQLGTPLPMFWLNGSVIIRLKY